MRSSPKNTVSSKKAIRVVGFFLGFLSRLTSANLSFLQPSIPEIYQLKFLKKLFPLKFFATVADYVPCKLPLELPRSTLVLPSNA